MRTPSKKAFLEDVRRHRAATVSSILRVRPDLISVEDAAGRKPLHVCARQKVTATGDARAAVATAKALLRAGADVNTVHRVQDDGEVFPVTALWYALAWGRNRPLATHLLKAKADPDHCMFALVFADDLSSAKLLRRYGAQIDEVGHGETPLIYAVRRRLPDSTLRELLKYGADAAAVSRDGVSVAELATRAQRHLLRLPV